MLHGQKVVESGSELYSGLVSNVCDTIFCLVTVGTLEKAQ